MAWGCDGSASPPEPRATTWQPAIRLSNSTRTASLSYNFAWSIAADHAGRVHAVWYESDSVVYYVGSVDSGAHWGTPMSLSLSGGASDPAIAVEGDDVYVIWHQLRAGAFEVMLRHSRDGGGTWQPEVRLSASGRSAHGSIAASGRHVYVVWGDVSTGNAEIHTRASHDGGTSWLLEQLVSDTPYESWVPTVAASGDTVMVGWVDYRDANEEEYLRRSTDGGRTWDAIQRLTFDAADSWAPSLAIAGNVVHIAWFDRRDVGITDAELEAALDSVTRMVGLPVTQAPPRTADVYYLQLFVARIQEKMQRILSAAPAWVGSGGDPKLLEAKLTSFTRRFETWASSWEIYYKRSKDGGVTWSEDTRLTYAPSMSARPSIALRGDTIDLVWFDSRTDKDNTEIYYKESLDGGETWTTDEQITSAPGGSVHPSVAAAGGWVHVVWSDEQDGNAQIWYRRRSP